MKRLCLIICCLGLSIFSIINVLDFQTNKVNALELTSDNGIFVFNYVGWQNLNYTLKIPDEEFGTQPQAWVDHPVHIVLEVYNVITRNIEILPLPAFDNVAHLFMWSEFYGSPSPIEVSTMAKEAGTPPNWYDFYGFFAYPIENPNIYLLEGVEFFFFETGYSAIFRPGDDPEGFSKIFGIYSFPDAYDEIIAAYQQGKQDGYTQGYNDGLAAGGDGITTNWFTSFVNSIFDIFNIEIFPNVKLIYLIFIPVGFGIILLILKLIRG